MKAFLSTVYLLLAEGGDLLGQLLRQDYGRETWRNVCAQVRGYWDQ